MTKREKLMVVLIALVTLWIGWGVPLFILTKEDVIEITSGYCKVWGVFTILVYVSQLYINIFDIKRFSGEWVFILLYSLAIGILINYPLLSQIFAK